MIWRSQYGVKGVGGCGSFLARNEDYWQTPKIHNFAQLNWLLHETQGECSYEALITHRGPREPLKESQCPKDPPEAQNGYEYKKIEKMNRINCYGPFLADSTFK